MSNFTHFTPGSEKHERYHSYFLVTFLEKSSGEGNGNPLQYSCLENRMDKGVWLATVHWVAKSQI